MSVGRGDLRFSFEFRFRFFFGCRRVYFDVAVVYAGRLVFDVVGVVVVRVAFDFYVRRLD